MLARPFHSLLNSGDYLLRPGFNLCVCLCHGKYLNVHEKLLFYNLHVVLCYRYNPWGKTKREQLQSWNILSFDPKNIDVDEHIDLINNLGDIVDQKEEAKKEKFIETMPTMIQTHLII